MLDIKNSHLRRRRSIPYTFRSNYLQYLLSAILLVWLSSLQGQNKLEQQIKRFTERDGLNTVIFTGIVQDSYGFIWLSTDLGIYRFDGQNFVQYSVFPASDGTKGGLIHLNAASLFCDSRDRIWTSLFWGGVSRLDRNTDRFISYESYWDDEVEYPIKTSHRFMELPTGEVLLESAGTILYFEEEENTFRKWNAGDFGIDSKPLVFGFEGNGTSWWQTERHLTTSFDQKKSQIQLAENIRRIKYLTISKKGIWVLSSQAQLHFYDLQAKRWKNVESRNVQLNRYKIFDLHQDRSGRIWLTLEKGIVYGKIIKENAEQLELTFEELVVEEKAHTLINLNHTLEDKEGRLWFASRGLGLMMLDENKIQFLLGEKSEIELDNLGFSLRNNERAIPFVPAHKKEAALARVRTLYEDEDYSLYEHGRDGMSFVDHTAINPVQYYYEENIPFVGQIVRDRNGDLWWSMDRGIYKSSGKVLNPKAENLEAVFPNYVGRKIEIDLRENVWIGSWADGIVRINPQTNHVEHYNPDKGTGKGLRGINAHRVLSLADSSVWVQTSKGLHKYTYASDSFEFFGPRESFPIHQASLMIKDYEDKLWFVIPHGFMRWDPIRFEAQIFDKSYGLPALVYWGLNISEKGILSATTGEGPFSMDLNSFSRPSAPPKLKFVSVKVQTDSVIRYINLLGKKQLELSHNDEQAEFEFTGFEFGQNGEIEYEYRIGERSNWIKIGSTEKLRIIDPEYGRQALEIRSRNASSNLYSTPAIMDLYVQAPWWARDWAFPVYALILLSFIFLSTRWRTRSLLKNKEKLEATVKERTKQIAKEKDRSEQLLLNILPKEIAGELKKEGRSQAQFMEEVTVIFTDFRDFTKISEKLSPKELVADLNAYFSSFDLIMEKYGIEKIKTIGDSYMAAGGLPTPNSRHAQDVLRAAFEVRDYIREEKRKKKLAEHPYFEIRIGIHSGPVVAGIVGVKKFQYDIWGDTVNTASRMESSGEIDRINISASTYDLLKEEKDFNFLSRGKVFAKGKGEMEMFFVERRS
ncbi:MAG: adenylate/guanylate cyclase domain-containing protein [Bacteroidia bacterium]|nr:adenylate/guanylate cyclase domain-containing protein [Bacteroidia bacterium]